ncbi:MAG: sporulation transcriptional regulator SpoIIID [Clostridia bacterium]|nr:sporulation transcriptional regulator SpoIIID [Clostridia bacterium]
MNYTVDNRAIILGEYIINTGATVRAAAKVFKISKSTVHKDVTQRLKREQPQLYLQVKKVLEKNKSERHIRGGLATKRKYKGE